MNKTFTVAGTSNLNGVVKFRFANDLKGRIKVLERNGHTDVQLFELPEAMTKEDATLWLQSRNQDSEQIIMDEEFSIEAEQADESELPTDAQSDGDESELPTDAQSDGDDYEIENIEDVFEADDFVEFANEEVEEVEDYM